MANGIDALGHTLSVLTIITIISNCASIVFRLAKDNNQPKLWKYSLLYQDISIVFLQIGIVLFYVSIRSDSSKICKATGYFLVFGLFECVLSFATTGIILVFVQNPGKPTSVSNLYRKAIFIIITPIVVLGVLLAGFPYISTNLFDATAEFRVRCLPIQRSGEKGAAYGALLVSLWWIILATAVAFDVVIALKLWKYHKRINSSDSNVWQAHLVIQGKFLLKLSISQHIVWTVFLLITTVAIYVKSEDVSDETCTWLVMTAVVLSAVLHSVFAHTGNRMWGTCCCGEKTAVEEPHRKLKKLELMKVECPGKLRMKATWNIGKHATKRGMLKVYGVNNLKAWAQEIVMLGMLRRAQHPSLLQCLWTNSSNPYYETMTLISGEIITSDSRVICLEMTNGGSLYDFLQSAELPLPEPCQRMIIHDIAEGLFYLHHENILHNNLTSSCIYLKGSLQSMVLRAAVGDFENGQIYGSLQQSLDSSIRDKRYFFLPDIRSFALLALEIVSKMCEKKFQNRYVNYDDENVPLKLNLTNVISDEDDEFEPNYGYEIEDTYRMFESVHPDVAESDYDMQHPKHQDVTFGRSDSMDNLLDKDRPTSPEYSVNPAFNSKPLDKVAVRYQTSESDDNEILQYGVVYGSSSSAATSLSPSVDSRTSDRCTSPIERRVARKSRKDMMSKSLERALSPKHEQHAHTPPKIKMNDQARCVSPDPMNDEKLQELRKETLSGTKYSKRDRKQSFNKKHKTDKTDVTLKNGQAFEVSSDHKHISKRKDGKWLSKPSSILKSIGTNETQVSVFKAKPVDDDYVLDAIDEEEIDNSQSAMARYKAQKAERERHKAEIWDIIDEQYYHQVDRKAVHKLKQTVSAESRSSLWSFISTPEDLDNDDDIEGILECLPGMAEPSDLRKSEIRVSDIMAQKEAADINLKQNKRFSYSMLNKSKFELIDYYEMLKTKQITFDQVPKDKREMLLNVVELKREEWLKREKKVPGYDIKSDEMYDNGMSPGGAEMTMSNAKGGNVKIVSFRRDQVHSSPHRAPIDNKQEQDPRKDRVKSAPLKRPRTPMQKRPQSKSPEGNPAFSERNNVKRTRARSALKRALHNKYPPLPRNDRGDRIASENVTLKYATVKKINCVTDPASNEYEDQTITVPVPTSESFSVLNIKPKPPPRPIDIKRFPSFSSNESSSSFASSGRMHKADVSLTSGELTSLESQAETDHFETDGNMTDVEGPSKSVLERKRKFVKGGGPGSRVDSGFDSGSLSSDMSDVYVHRNNKHYVPVYHSRNPNMTRNLKGSVGSWARGYKVADGGTINAFNKFVPPIVPEETYYSGSPVSSDKRSSSVTNAFSTSSNSPTIRNDVKDNDSGIYMALTKSNPSGKGKQYRKVIEVSATKSKGTINLNRPMSPASRPLSPLSRPPTSQRPMSPNVRPTDNRPTHKSGNQQRPFSPNGRPMSPDRGPPARNRSMSPNWRSESPSRPMSPKQPLSPGNINRTMSPEPQMYSVHTTPSPTSRSLSPHNRNGLITTNQTGVYQIQNSICSTPTIQIDRPEYTGMCGDSENPSQATRRYRELVKEGVPLRTSVIDSSPTRGPSENTDGVPPEHSARPGTAESNFEEQMDDQQLYEDLESKGFFANRRSRSPSPQKGTSPTRNLEGNHKHGKDKRKRNKRIPLDEIVRETPEQTSSAHRAHRSSSSNHLTVSEDMYLNQPTSEDSETCSIKTNKSSNSLPPGTKAKVVVDAEIVIDRIFSTNNGNALDVEVEAALGLDKDPFKTLHELNPHDSKHLNQDLENIPLLNGVNQKHIHGCLELANSLHVITMRDLLPARKDSFKILRTKLQQVGQLGTVGNQLMDIIHKCWLIDMPPTSGDLVEQLTDPVTETEL